MNIEKVFSKVPRFKNISLDKVLFESKYPVMFTCKNDNDIYLFICCLVNSNSIKWIGTKTNYDILIAMLENEVTIRNAFLSVTDEKIVIEYNGDKVTYSILKSDNIQKDLLPTAGEYMDAEGDEYIQEIKEFKLRNDNIEYKIQPLINNYIFIYYPAKNVRLPDGCFIEEIENNYEIKFSIRNIQENKVVEWV